MHESISQICNRIKHDGSKQQGHAPHAVAENAEENSADEHPQHLQIQQQDAVVHQRIAGVAQVFEAGNPQDGEEDQIIHIYKIAESAHDDGGVQHLAQSGW